MNERAGFLKLLAENEDDTITRLVYADWLDDRGEHEEADRHRKWPAAKQWLVSFFRDHDGGDYHGGLNTFAQLIELGRVAVAESHEGGIGLDCGSNESLCDALRAHRAVFWKHWSVVTGIPVTVTAAEQSRFGCSC